MNLFSKALQETSRISNIGDKLLAVAIVMTEFERHLYVGGNEEGEPGRVWSHRAATG